MKILFIDLCFTSCLPLVMRPSMIITCFFLANQRQILLECRILQSTGSSKITICLINRFNPTLRLWQIIVAICIKMLFFVLQFRTFVQSPVLVKTIINAYPYFCVTIITLFKFIALKLPIFIIVHNIRNIDKRFSHFDVSLLSFKLKNQSNFCLLIVTCSGIDS